MIKTDVAIIGAGPVGLFAAFECGMFGLSTTIIDALPFAGGQCAALYPEKPIYDIPAHPNILALDLIRNLEKQVAPFNPTYLLESKITSLNKSEDDSFVLTTDKGQSINVKAVIIAAGVGAFGPNRPPLEGILSYENKSIFYAVHNTEIYRDKTVVVAGGGDSAVDWAVVLADIAKKVYVVHRRDHFRASPHSVEQLKSKERIELVIPYNLKALDGKDGILSKVIVSDLDGNEKILEADYLLPFYGLAMNLGPILNWGLGVDSKHIKIEHSTCLTNVPGVYAIGDIATYEGKMKLILCGFSEGAMAANAIYKQIHPDVPLHFEYSTTKGIPGR